MAFTVSTRTGGGIVGKIAFTAFGLFFAFIGTQAVKQEWRSLQETKAMQQWPQTSCTIVSSEMKDHGEDFRLELSYSYQVNGQAYTAERYGKQKYYTAGSIGNVDDLQKRLSPGTQRHCFYNPENPSEAVLKRPKPKGSRTSFFMTFLFPGFGLLFATLPWLVGRKKRRKAGESVQASKTASPSGKWGIVIFGALFAVVGLVMLKPLLLTPLQKTRDAKTWNTVEAVVVSSKVKSHTSDDSTTYSPYIAYRYEIAGEEYLNDRYSFMGGSSSGRAGKAEIVRQFPKGHVFNLYVNPADPEDSVIKRELSNELLLGLIPAVFFLAGVVVMIAGFRARKAKLDPAQAGEHVVMLKGSSPIGKAVGITLFATIWNGIVFFIFRSDAPLAMAIIFGVFGLIMIGAVVHSVLALFNPRPEVEITPGDIRPGTSVAMRWRTTGRTDRIEKLTISLQCLRITTESSGTGKNRSSRVVKRPLLTEELLQSDSPHEIAQGTAQFRIPDEQPASIPGNHGGIRWQLLFHGDIPRWPDLKQELSFTVYPAD